MGTLDPNARRTYVCGMAQLSVWYVHRLLECGEIPPGGIPAALSDRVNLYRLTDLWDGTNDDDGSRNPEWQTCTTQIARWVLAAPRATAQGDTALLEQQTLTLLEPSLERRLPRDLDPPPAGPFGCWTSELGWPGFADRPGRLGKLTNTAHLTDALRRVVGLAPRPSRDGVLHFTNVLAPASPFDDLLALAGSLRALIAHLREHHPEVRELWCNTWLNEHPKFREIFPDPWFRNGVVAPPGRFRNWWGQFARRDGGFNQTLAQRFRASGGTFPFRALLCHAGLDEVDRHLATHFLPEPSTS